jgi:hypothetical protein
VPLRHLASSSRQPGAALLMRRAFFWSGRISNKDLIRNYKDIYSRKLVLITTLEPTKITSAPKARGATNEGPPVCFK